MGKRAQRGMPTIVAGLVLAAVGCGGGDEADDGSTAPQTPAPEGGLLFSHTVGSGSLGESGNGELELSFAEPAPKVTVFTDRPVRSAATESVSEFVDRWEERFGDVPPNAALVVDQHADEADTLVLEILDPRLDEDSGELTYTAREVEGGTSEALSDEAADGSFGDAHLFIDPGGGSTESLTLEVRGSTGGRTTLTFDDPWRVILGDGEEAVELLYPAQGGAAVTTTEVTLTRSGDVAFSVTGGSGPITGTARLGTGNATLQLGDYPQEPLQNGRFSIGG